MNLRDVLKMAMMNKREVALQMFIFEKVRRIKALEKELYRAREEILFMNDLNNSLLKSVSEEGEEGILKLIDTDHLYNDIRKKNEKFERKMDVGYRAKVRKEIEKLIKGTTPTK